MFIRRVVNIEEETNDNEDWRASFDRRCIPLALASEVERKANAGLRVGSRNEINQDIDQCVPRLLMRF